MKTPPRAPVPGERLSATWLAELVRYVRETAPVAGPGLLSRQTPNGTVLSARPGKRGKSADRPLPYEVRCDASYQGEHGDGLKIYLPTDHLLAWRGAYAKPEGVTAAESGDGWHYLDKVSKDDDHVYLVVTVDEESGEIASAKFDFEKGQATTGEKVYNVCVAELEHGGGGEAPPTVKQSLVGALHLDGWDKGGGGSGGLEGEVEFVADIDWYVNGSVYQLRKRLRVLDLATGAVADKAGTTYANGWEIAANTTPISSIVGS